MTNSIDDLSVDDVNRVLRAAFAGSQAGVVYDGEKRFGLVVRLDKDYRQSLDDVRNLSVALPGGGQIPFEQLAAIEIKSGPAQVSRENTNRRINIGFNVRNRDVRSVIDEVSRLIDAKIKLPTGYYLSYGGQFQNFEAAKDRLMIAVPAALLLIFVLLYFTFHSLKQTLLISSAVPLAAIGGVFALWIRGMNFSISAGVGFIALFGVAVLNGIVLIAEFNRLEKEGITDLHQRVLKGLHTRLRPVIMTAAVASLGFLPMALSTSAGAEVQKPLATVVIGGLISATFLTLVILPVFYIISSSPSFMSFVIRKSIRKAPLLLIVLFVMFLGGPANAQEVKILGLNQAIRMALDSNLSVQASALSVDVQKVLRQASWDLPKTSIEGQYGQFNSILNDNSLAVSQSFVFPTLYMQQNRLARAGVKSAEWQQKVSQLETATQVKQIYWQLAYLHDKRKLLAFQDSLYTGFFRAADLRARIGETNRLEMITARSRSLEVKNQLQQVGIDLEIFYQKLRTVVNTHLDIRFTDSLLHRNSFSPGSPGPEMDSNPSVGLVKQQVEVSHLEKKVEASRWLPDLTIGYFNQSIRGTQDVNGLARTFMPGDRFTGVQAGIAIPLWFKPYVARAKAASLKEKVAQTNAEYFSKSVEGSYQSLLGEYAKYASSLDYYEKQAIPESEIIIDQATRSYKAGAMDYIEYILNMDRALQIRHNYLETLNSFNQTVVSLEFITGKIF